VGLAQLPAPTGVDHLRRGPGHARYNGTYRHTRRAQPAVADTHAGGYGARKPQLREDETTTSSDTLHLVPGRHSLPSCGSTVCGAVFRVPGGHGAQVTRSSRSHSAVFSLPVLVSSAPLRSRPFLGQAPQAQCWSEYYWAVSVSMEVLHVTHSSGGNATQEVVSTLPGAPAPVSLTVRPPTPWFTDAEALATQFAPRTVVPCAVDAASGAVRLPENFTSLLRARSTTSAGQASPSDAVAASQGRSSVPRRHHAAPPGGPVPGSPGPLAVVVLHALWGSFLDGLGVARRPPPSWLIRMGWLPWWRVVGPGVPLLSLSSLRTAVRSLDLNTGVLDAVIVPAMLAAAAEAACAVLAETQLAAHERARTGASMLPIWCALAHVLSCALLVVLCVAEPVARELRRAWRVLNGNVNGDGGHPLGETLPRSNSGRLRPLTRSQTAAGMRID